VLCAYGCKNSVHNWQKEICNVYYILRSVCIVVGVVSPLEGQTQLPPDDWPLIVLVLSTLFVMYTICVVVEHQSKCGVSSNVWFLSSLSCYSTCTAEQTVLLSILLIWYLILMHVMCLTTQKQRLDLTHTQFYMKISEIIVCIIFG